RRRIKSNRLGDTFFARRQLQPLSPPLAVVGIEHDLVEPGAHISAGFKAMKRAPSLQKSLLHQVFSLPAIADEPERDTEYLIGIAKRDRFKFPVSLLSVPAQI